ncbi:MAG: helix-turn-helix transcriptional regulator [Kineosporiaceae bacterium]
MQIAREESAVAAGTAATGTAARDRVFRAVLSHGPVEVVAVARRLGVTPAAVRRHIEALEADGLVAVHEAASVRPRGRGRPARAYVVTARGHRAAGGGYEEVALSALAHLARQYGPDAVARFTDERLRELESRWRSTVDRAGPDPLARARALAAALGEDGFAAEARDVEPHPGGRDRGREGGQGDAGTVRGPLGVQICQGHCPVHTLAEAYPGLCEAETATFSRLVGTPVQRLATIAHGDHVCTTFVPGPPAAPPAPPEPAAVDAVRGENP